MIVVPVIPSQRDALESTLHSMNLAAGKVDPDNTIIPFAQFSTLHTARLVILQANTGDDIRTYGWQPHHWQVSLALLGDVDGDATEFLAQLAVVAPSGLSMIFRHCEGYSEHQGSLLEFLKAHERRSAATYVNWIGRTVRSVSEDAKLQRSLSDALPDIVESAGRENTRHIRQQLLDHVQHEVHAGRLSLISDARTPLRYRLLTILHLVGLPVLLLVLSPLLLVLAPFVLWRLRSLETSDPDIDIRPDKRHLSSLSAIEDHDTSNQFNVFGDIKPGVFRYALLKVVMVLVNYTARHIYRRGNLGRVRTIHFARWVFLNGNRSMYFASLYDGSLESYMDDFINKVAFGLNLTFSHGVGYPRTRWMIKGGAESEQPFKDTLRRHQLPSQVWYMAHPGLTAIDMARNARIRRGIEVYPTDDKLIRDWLADI